MDKERFFKLKVNYKEAFIEGLSGTLNVTGNHFRPTFNIQSKPSESSQTVLTRYKHQVESYIGQAAQKVLNDRG